MREPDQAAGQRLGQAQRPAPLAEQALDHGLHRLVVDAEDEVAEDRPAGSASSASMRPAASSSRLRLGRDPHDRDLRCPGPGRRWWGWSGRRPGRRSAPPAPTPNVPHVLRSGRGSAAAPPTAPAGAGITAVGRPCAASRAGPRERRRSPCRPPGRAARGRCRWGWGSARPPSGTSAWRRLLAGIDRPRDRNISRMASARCRRGAPGRSPITSAMASRVMSSWVGPSPPQTITASASLQQSSAAVSTIRAWLSPTCDVEVAVDAGGGQLLADPGAVGVDDLAEEELRPHGEDVTPHVGGVHWGSAAGPRARCRGPRPP